tara:strand:+ start:100 stop:273 length:174 start_codon:yes stop_codon:yes gene_type:complete
MRPCACRWSFCLDHVGLYAFNLFRRSRVSVVVPNARETGDFATENEDGEGLIADAIT